MSPPLFVVSLDFELHWGVRDHSTVEDYRANLLGVREAIPALLELFKRRGIAATWATVGFLFAETKAELERHFPRLLPTYTDPKMSPYAAMSEVGANEKVDPFHFGASLVRRIAATPRQELATHTFSHFYCLEPGQTIEQFDADLDAASAIARENVNSLKSIVFPRNQFTEAHLDILNRRGYLAYRGNGDHWAYAAAARETKRRRLFRLVDTFLPLSGARAMNPARGHAVLVDVPASAFLRPCLPRLRTLEPVRRARLVQALRRSVKQGNGFHLWWHPHNFGTSVARNLSFLSDILDEVETLRRTHGLESVTMAEAAAV